MSQKLYREISIEKLTSPEHLDRLVKVTSPVSWIALLGIGGILVSVVAWGLMGSLSTVVDGPGILLDNGKVISVYSRNTGLVDAVNFKDGDMVKKGEIIAVVDQDTQVIAPVDGRILEINIHSGSYVNPGDPLAVIDEIGDRVKLEALVYVSAEKAGTIQPGMTVQLSPSFANKEEYGFLLGKVRSVSNYPDTYENMMDTIGNENLVVMLTGEGVPMMVQVDLIPDVQSKSGHLWSSHKGSQLAVHSGTLIHAEIITRKERPINKVIPIQNLQSVDGGQRE